MKKLYCLGKNNIGCEGTLFEIVNDNNKVYVICEKCGDKSELSSAFTSMEKSE